MLVLLIVWCLFWEGIYFYHTLIFVKFHLYGLKDPSLWRQVFRRSSIRFWLCWEGLLLWVILLPLDMGVFLAWLWQDGGGVGKAILSALVLVGGPLSLHWADTQLPQFFQRFGTVAAKRWTLEGMPMRYIRFLSTVLFRRKMADAEQASLLFYLAYFTDAEQETMLFGEKKKPSRHKAHRRRKNDG